MESTNLLFKNVLKGQNFKKCALILVIFNMKGIIVFSFMSTTSLR
jgi:hypothetical protein